MSAPSVVLLSGGIDSAVTLAIAKAGGFVPSALSFSYGQRHAAELDAAARVAEAQGVAGHVVATLPRGLFGGSALTDARITLPGTPATEVDATYVPARNTVFLSMALAYAESIGARDIFIGVNADDHAGYPDCRPEYLNAFQRMAALATAAGPVMIHAPLLMMTKAQIVSLGRNLGVDFAITRSCYSTPPGVCGSCGACILRAAAFAEVGIPDPALAGERR